MRVNWKRFAFVFAVLTALTFCAACTSAWLSAVSGLLPGIVAVVNAVLAFVTALEGKTVSADVTAAIQKWQANVAAEIQNAQSIIAAYQQNASTGLLSQFQAVMQAIINDLNSILSGLAITDSATVAKITQFVALAVAAANAVLALIPMAIQKLQSGASAEELKHYDKLGATAVGNAVKTMKETYVAIVQEKTTNNDVNTALDALPPSI